MATIDPTKRVAVSWFDYEGPDRARLTVAWLDERDQEMAIDRRGLDAYWIAQCFKARDAVIAQQRDELARLNRQLSEVRERLSRAFKVAVGG